MNSTNIVDIYFRVVGEKVRADHGYLLYSALSTLLDGVENGWLHKADLAILPIHGVYSGDGWLMINREAEFGFRLPAEDIPRVLPLAGKQLRIGESLLRIGTTSARSLKPSATLHSRITTTRNGNDEARFDVEISRQMKALDVKGIAQRGRRRVMKIRDRKVAGHELLVTGLNAEESIRLQEHGLGGRRKMGAGVFVPVQDGETR